MPILPMLAVSADVPPVGDGWAFEFKWDGVRIIATVDNGVKLHSRGGLDVTAGFPELSSLSGNMVLDGEVVALDPQGLPDFGLLQQRWNINSGTPRFVGRIPICYMVFDLLALDGESLLSWSYSRRRAMLSELCLESSCVRVSPSFTDTTGELMLEVAKTHGLEGIMAKRVDSRYEPGVRCPSWVKTVLWSSQEVVVCGWRPDDSGRLGSLLLGVYDSKGQLRYVGSVSQGVPRADIAVRLEQLEPLSVSPFLKPIPRSHSRGARWCQPQLVGEVQYRTISRNGRFRYPVWRGLRPDKTPREAVLV